MKSIRIVGKCGVVLVMFALAGPISLADELTAKPHGTMGSFDKVKTISSPESSRTLQRVGGEAIDGALSVASSHDERGSTCDPDCDWCWCGTEYEGACDDSWWYDYDCDCGCQWCDPMCWDCDMQECIGGGSSGACCGPYQVTPECMENVTEATCINAGGAYMGDWVTCAAVNNCWNRCASECVWCWTGTAAENNCDPSWNGDGECDCGCQFCDSDCPSCGGGGGACCSPNQSIPECIEGITEAVCLAAGGAPMGTGVTCAAVNGCANRCDSGCIWCWYGTLAQNNCELSWNGDGECDCGCQFEDVDCGPPVCGDGVCDCSRGETTANCPADCVDVPCDAGEYVPDLPCGSDYGRNREMCAATYELCGDCRPVCDNCWCGTEYENDCPVGWIENGACDCGCQFDDDLDCGGTRPCHPCRSASAEVCVEVFAPECGSASCLIPTVCESVDPVCATSVWDSVLGKYIFCPIYTAGPCVGEVCVRLWIDNDGPCDPELWWRFDQIGPGPVVSTYPPNCAIDACQPSNPDGTNPDGLTIDITFTCDASNLMPEDFTVRVVPGPATVPVITAVVPTGTPETVGLELDRHIPTGQWTCFKYVQSGSEVCLGYLPADVNGDRTSAPPDILRVIDCLNGVATCETWQCDVDRSGVCGPPDILRVIDLLNGAGVYDPWLNVSIPVCPSAP